MLRTVGQEGLQAHLIPGERPQGSGLFLAECSALSGWDGNGKNGAEPGWK